MSEIEELKSYLERSKLKRQSLALLGQETSEQAQKSLRSLKSKLTANDITHISKLIIKQRLELTPIPERKSLTKYIKNREFSVPNLFLSRDNLKHSPDSSRIKHRSRKDLLLDIYTPKSIPAKLTPISTHKHFIMTKSHIPSKSPTSNKTSEGFKLKTSESSTRSHLYRSGDLEFEQFKQYTSKKKLLPLLLTESEQVRFERKRKLVEIYTSP
jgi:hypothetical protein